MPRKSGAFFLEFYFITVGVEKFKLGEVIACVGNNRDGFAKLAFPFRHLRFPEETFGEVGVKDRVGNDREFFVVVGKQVAKVLFNVIFQQK